MNEYEYVCRWCGDEKGADGDWAAAHVHCLSALAVTEHLPEAEDLLNDAVSAELVRRQPSAPSP